MNLRSLFPRGSKAFFQANEIKTDHPLPDPHPKRHKKAALDRTVSREKESMGRTTLSYRIFRVRVLDPDTVAGSTKDLTDGLRRCGCISGDDPTQIRLEVEQERVRTFADERVELTITWAE